jgi:glucose/arabinose dehydrogenase
VRGVAKLLLGLTGAAVLGAGACHLLLPERYAVNVPLRQALFGRGIDPPQDEVLRRLQAPPGFRVTRYAAELPGARFLRFTPTGDLLVSLPYSGRIVLLERDANGDGQADGARDLLQGLNRPHGMDLHQGWLYVGETDAVARVRFDPASRATQGPIERVVTGLPALGNHWTRTVRFGPDGLLYVSVGSSCNACLEKDPRRAAILRFRPDGSGGEIYASGLRNSVGFDWRPGTDELYATDNGRDFLGDDFPPCELNRIVQGGFYGWPFLNGHNVPDPDFGATPQAAAKRASAIPPVHEFRPHNAPLGMTFLRGESLPPDLRGAALVALHGSWNRTRKDGYKVVSLHWEPDGTIDERDFLTGFLVDEDVIGRPVDVAQGPDGAIYVSDDYAGSVYRVAVGEAPPASAAASPAPPARSEERP